MQSHNLNRPSRLTLIWPRLLILPPLSVYLLRAAYRSRASLAEMANEAVETLEGFFTDWLLEPVKGIIKTIRAGGEEGVIVTKQGVAADMDVSARD
jgi:nuclear-control-of-ATPase protein 2